MLPHDDYNGNGNDYNGNDKVIGSMRPEEDLFLTISETSEPRKWWVLYGEQCWVGQRRAGRFDEW